LANVLEINNLSKKYGSWLALDNINLSVAGGKIIGLLGPNGSGKTTMLKLIAGLLTPTSGAIFVDGKPVGAETKEIVSFLPERTYLDPNMAVAECIEYFADFYKDFDSVKAMKMIASLGVNATSRLKTLSKGTKEKVQLVLVMSRRAKLFLLDEPIGGVDPAAREFIMRTILTNYQEGATIIISTHLIRDIEEILDEYIFINNNHLVSYGNVKKVHEQNKTVDELFREVFRCYPVY